ncbi:ATP-binding protein [Streptomyces sp. NPDC001351]|uniref:ATP-binding protein n=1 Tax=Streptomyces sp. NPDC001351 TaxID=3364564 RepID=UPI0036A9D85C
MRHEISVAAFLGMAAVLVAAAALAAYYAWQFAKHREQAAHWQEIAVAQDAALMTLASTSLEQVAAALQQPQTTSTEITVPDCLTGSDFVNNLRLIGERYVADLHRVRAETAVATRRQVEAEAREAAKAAVKSFATAMVSTGIDVSSDIAQALRQHHSNSTFAALTRIDHGVQQMLHQAQSYVVLAGGLLGQRWPASTLTDVIGAAQGAIRDYARVQPYASDRAVIARMVGPVKLILSHLLDNAARYSPPQTRVDVSAQHGHHGITLLIDDAGKRMSEEQLLRTQRILSGQQEVDILNIEAHPRVGFPVISLLARRYGIKVVLSDSNRYGGMCASVFLPEALLTTVPAHLEPAPEPAVFEPTAPAQLTVTENGLPTRTARRPKQQQPQGTGGRRVSTAPTRTSVIGAWQQGTRRARTVGAPAPARDQQAAATHTDQEEGSIDS